MEEDAPLIRRISAPYFGEDLDPGRWWILLCFVLYGCFSQVLSNSYPILNATALEYFNIDDRKLQVFVDIGTVLTFLFSYPGAYFAFKRPTNTLIILLSLVCIGGWITFVAGSNYTWALIGQILISIGSSPISGIAVLLPDRWFPIKERLFAMTIALYSTGLGGILIQILALWIVNEDKSQIPFYILLQAVLGTIPLILGFIYLKDKPRVPPSYTALISLADPLSFWSQMKTMLTKPKFLAFFVTFGITLGVSLSTNVALRNCFRRLELPDFYSNLTCIGFQVFGIVIAILSNIHLTVKNKMNYDYLIKALLLFSFVNLGALGVIVSLLGVTNLIAIIFLGSLAGAGLVGVLPFLFSSIADSTYPAAEYISGNTLGLAQSLFNLVINQIVILPVISMNGRGLLLLPLCLIPGCIYGLFCFKTEYKKQGTDITHQEIDDRSMESIAELNEKASFGFSIASYKNAQKFGF